ncbi:MAG TPA: hypothetical protein VM845_00195 [Burkholderiaceae bacterium]|nr:hypothetical protein [Burkholderiaceae bacterium]
MRCSFPRLGVVLAGLLAAACAGLPTARMALPDVLAAQAPLALQGLDGGRRGELALAGERGPYERGADRLTVFDSLSFDRVSARYRTESTGAACRGRQTEGTLGVLTGQPRPFEFQCQYDGAFSGQLTLRGHAGAAGTQQQRSGRLAAGGVVVDIVSVHRLQGTPLSLASPAGYVLSIAGQPEGAVELTDTRPRVWLPSAPGPARTAVTHAALTLALLWDPSQRGTE